MAIAGYGGNVKVKSGEDSNVVAEIGSWELEIESNAEEVPVFGSKWNRHVSGLNTWSGSFEGYWKSGDSLGQQVLWESIINGTEVELELFTNDTDSYSGVAIIEAIGVETEAEGVVTISFDFLGNGELNIPGVT